MARSDYSGFAKLLHWLIVLVIAGMVGLGVYMTDVQGDLQYKLWLYQLHKSFGVTLFALVIVRLVWRQISPPPPLPAAMPEWERRASRFAHIGLYVLMFAIPLSGWARVSASPLSVPTEVFGLFTLPHLPFLASMSSADKEALEPVFQSVHSTLAWTLVALVAVHAAAALRHAFILKDDVMTRMLPRRSRRPATSLALAGLLVPLAMTAGEARAAQWTVQPDQSEIAFSGEAAGQTVEGVFEDFSGSVEFDSEAPENTTATIIIQLDSVKTGNSDVDGTLPGSDWFNTGDYPKAVFTADGAARAEGDNAYVLNGTLELKGNAGDVAVPFTIDAEGDTATANGNITINRLEYGVGPDGPVSGITVGEEVTISFTLHAEKAK
ncbi:MAG: cytochrome b/b6 domain-containing protein [Dichotomicrobium sp.]